MVHEFVCSYSKTTFAGKFLFGGDTETINFCFVVEGLVKLVEVVTLTGYTV